MRRLILVFVLSVSVLTSVSLARTWHVNPYGTGEVPTIQAGVDTAAVGDTLLLADGTYRGPGNRDVTVDVAITIKSESEDPELCIIDCEGSPAERHRGFYVDAGSSWRQPTIVGLTVTNGYRMAGAAIAVTVPGCFIRNCHFLNNEAGDEGGALWVVDYYDPDATVVSECYFADNYAPVGGAVFATYYNTSLILEYCMFERNSALYGGAVYVFEDWEYGIGVYVKNCTMVGNSGYGSAVINDTFSTSSCRIMRSIMANGTGGPACIDCQVSCCNLYENQPDPDWLPPGDGNFLGCPSFCNALEGDFFLCDQSPCLPGNHPDGNDCGLIGAFGAGCSCGPSATEPISWGGIKSMYR